MKKIICEQVIPEHEPYTLYVEHFFSALRGFLGSAPNCVNCNLMEEGTLSYMKKYWCEYGVRRRYLEGDFKRRFKSRLVTRGHFFRHLFKIYSLPTNEKISAYGINEGCFPNPELIENIVVPFYKDKQVDLSQIPDNATIFFMELAIDLSYFKDNDAFWDKLTEVLPFIKAEELYVKFHLRNTSQTRERLMAILEASGRSYTILPDSLPTEQVFLHKKNLKIYGLRTSCLLYGSLLKGGTVLSFEDFFIHLYKETLLIEDALRLLLEKHINFLKPKDFPKTLS